VGISISFACEEGSFYLPQIEEFIGRKLECIVPEEDLLVPAPKSNIRGQKKRNGREET
jgi:ATP-dependent RNA helicase RhlB